jgi:hypothetical protein
MLRKRAKRLALSLVRDREARVFGVDEKIS